jgi:hypothetical protein
MRMKSGVKTPRVRVLKVAKREDVHMSALGDAHG